MGAITLDHFPKAPLGEVGWVGLALSFDYFLV